MLITCGKVISAEEIDKKLVLIVVPDFSFQEVEWLYENGETQDL